MNDATRFDVVIVGAGPAGLAAAVTASAGTSSIALIDEGSAPGGQIWRRDSRTGHSLEGREWMKALERTPVTVLDRATVVDASVGGGRHRLLIQRERRTLAVESATVILATGARELFLPFPGWTLPGVLGVGGAQAMAKAGLDVRGRRVVVSGTGPLLVAVAAGLARRGAEIEAVVEQAPVSRMLRFMGALAGKPRTALEALRFAQELRGGTVRFGSWVTEARGREALERVVVTDGATRQVLDCDLLCTAYGLVPNTELARLMGCHGDARGVAVDAHQRTSVTGVFAAGECAGIAGVEAALIEGMVAAEAAVGIPPSAFVQRRRDQARRWGTMLDRAFALRPDVLALARPDTIVCRCEDVRLGALDESWTRRQAKLYARAGMGACQGRVCGAALERLRGWGEDVVRAPLIPVSLSTLARPAGASGAH
ncbi:MAG TPA: FAD/NAD(P)-binding oxidoreductase [Gemmatimonadaceae bacterium]|nr:FAD/NAD(P)-binding oxidoreductase [Gemmatimonadaceae bacterium]